MSFPTLPNSCAHYLKLPQFKSIKDVANPKTLSQQNQLGARLGALYQARDRGSVVQAINQLYWSLPYRSEPHYFTIRDIRQRTSNGSRCKIKVFFTPAVHQHDLVCEFFTRNPLFNVLQAKSYLSPQRRYQLNLIRLDLGHYEKLFSHTSVKRPTLGVQDRRHPVRSNTWPSVNHFRR